MKRRRFLFGTGVVGAVTFANLLKSPTLVRAIPLKAEGSNWQNQWKWCSKCQGLFFYGGADNGPCPTGGRHNAWGSGDYFLIHDNRDFPGQNQWKWCYKCQGLFYYGNPDNGVCPAGGEHNPRGSFDYALMPDNPNYRGQHSWRWCNKCEGLFFIGNNTSGACPAGGGHDDWGSFDYSILMNVDLKMSGVQIDPGP